MKEVLDIGLMANTSLRKEEKENMPTTSDCLQGRKLLVYKMALYLAKMSQHDYELSGRLPSLVAVGALYVALKIIEQLKKTVLITNELVKRMVHVSRCLEADIIEAA